MGTHAHRKASGRATRPDAVVVAPKKLTFKEKQEGEGLPAKIEAIESEIARFHELLTQPDYFKSPPAQLVSDPRRL